MRHSAGREKRKTGESSYDTVFSNEGRRQQMFSYATD